MARRIGKDQLDAVLASDLDEGARVLWVYLATCAPAGLGRMRLEERLVLVDFDLAVEVLEEAKLLKRQTGKLKALPFLIPKAEEEDKDPTPLREAAELMFAEYNAARSEAGIDIPAGRTDKTMTKMEELAEWLADATIEFSDFLRFAIERTAFLAERENNAIAFLPVNMLTGPWLREEFASVAPGKRGGKHAGKGYGTKDGLAAQLKVAGFDRAERMTDRELRHVQNWAESMIADPIGFPDPDPKWRGEILFVHRKLQLKKQRGA